MSRRRPHTCGAPGPRDAHCTDYPGHNYSCYDAGEDVSFNDRQDWLSPHACDDPSCPDQGFEPGEGHPMSTCPFCQRIEAHDYEQSYGGEVVVRFEPLNPVTPGHMLFVPGAHLTHPSQEGVRAAMGYAERYAGQQGEDFNLITSSGPAATQTVPHIHVHYVPRRESDGLPLPWTPQQANEED